MEFVNTNNWITAIVTLTLFAVLYVLSEKRRKRTLRSLISDSMMPKLVSSACSLRRHWRSILFLISWVLISFCLMRPFSGTDFETRRQSSRDILVLLDISNSMNVIDCYGESRLNYSKKTLMKLSRELPTDRFGLIAFSGIPFLEMPLTSDSFSFEQALQETDSDNIPYGGTNIEYALKKAESEFKEGAAHKAVILISDGEEISGSTEQIVKTLVEKKIKVITVQTGDERKAGTVRNAAGTPIRKRSGELITSKAEGTVLSKLAEETGGNYIAFNPGSHNRDQLMKIKGEIQSMTASEGENDTVEKPREIFQPFLLAAIILLIIRLFLGERKRQLQGIAAILIACSVSLRAQDNSPVTLPPQNQTALTKEEQKKLEQLKLAEPDLRKKVNDENLDDDLKALAWYNLGINLAEQHRINPVEAHHEDIDKKAPRETQEGSFSKAESAFANALGYTGDNKKVEAATIHNKGALYHSEARRIFILDPDAAINFLKEASSSYRAALVLNPGDEQSRKNLELSYIHRKEAEIVLQIKKLHEEAKKSTGSALTDIRKWTDSQNKKSLQKTVSDNISKASQAVVKAAVKAKSIEQPKMQELYTKVDSHLQKALAEVGNFEKSENRKRAEINTAEAYKLLGGNPDQPEQEQNQNQNDNKEQDKQDQNPEDQNDNKQDKQNQNQDNKGDEKKPNDDPKENNPKENNPDNKPQDGKDQEKNPDNKLNPEDQKGDFNKNEAMEQKSQVDDKKQASIREAEALLRKMQKEEKEVREALRNERARDIIREMRRQGIYVPPESNK